MNRPPMYPSPHPNPNPLSPANMKTPITTLAALLGSALFLAGCSHKKEEDAEKAKKAANAPVQVVTAQVQRQDVPVYLNGVGSVTANATVTVKTRIDGALDKLHYVEGQDVKAGDLLAEIDSRALRAQLLQAQAARAKDAAQLANARNDLGRYTRLRADDAATQQTLDAQKANVAQLEAAVQADDAQIKYDQVQIDYTRITAPISGRTGTRLVDVGNIVHAADTNGLVVINQIDPITVLFTLPGEDVQRIGAAGGNRPLAVTATTRDGATELARGDLVLLNNQVDTTSGTVQLKGRFANPKRALWPGQYVNMRLQLGTLTGAATVPSAAVQRGQNGTFVYLIKDDGTAAMQPVTIGQAGDGVTVIAKGVQPGQRIVVDGQSKLKPGAHIVDAAQQARAPGAPATPAAPAAAPAAPAARQGA
jgi:multidrug efflux system membrane fusion protein